MLDAFKYYELSKAYLNVSKTILNLDYDDPYYNSLKETINSNIKPLKNMEGLYLTLSSRRNLIFNLLLNIFAYDFFLSLVYNFKVKKVTDLTNLFESVAKIEVIASFAIIGIDNEIYSIPEEDNNIEAKDIYHPLVKNCVSNDFKLEGGVILTGSNMSGKTTFMRTIGINQVLFNAGGLVCAKSFKSLYLPIYTSLRANDMLKEGISTFYAEILRMKKANEGIKEGKSLILIDEIFKGTNAYERISASFKVIDKFNEYKALFIISSHDFELCEAKNILNYHFSEYYNDDNKIAFDYKIKEGKCETKNALYLLKMANIID
jgi:DNA mismatch repair ATPase MutS